MSTLAVNKIITGIKDSLDIELKENISLEELTSVLAEHIHYLIGSNFNRLLNILYRIDISEKKLKQLLDENQTQDAGMIIAQLIIKRQIQKAESREKFRKEGENNIDENEKW